MAAQNDTKPENRAVGGNAPEAYLLWRRNRMVALVSVALVRGGFTMVTPFLPIYLRDLGVTDVSENALWSGAIISIGPFLAALMGPLWARLVDRYGLKLMALRVMAVFCLTWIVFGLATNLSHVVLSRVVAGLLGGYLALSVPMVTAGCPKDQLSRAVGAVQSVRIASMALGPLVGGILADLIGVRNTALVAAGLHVVGFFQVVFFYTEMKTLAPSEEAQVSLKLRQLLRNRALLIPFLILFLGSLIDRGINPLMALMVLEMGTPAEEAGRVAGLILGLAAVTATLSAWGFGRLGDQWGSARLLQAAALLGLVSSLPLALVGSPFQLGVVRVLLGLAVGGILTLGYVWGSEVFPERSRTSGIVLLSSGLLLGNALGPLVVGALAALGLRLGLAFAVPTFLALLLIARLDASRPESDSG